MLFFVCVVQVVPQFMLGSSGILDHGEKQLGVDVAESEWSALKAFVGQDEEVS